jgi:hypothetical protein
MMLRALFLKQNVLHVSLNQKAKMSNDTDNGNGVGVVAFWFVRWLSRDVLLAEHLSIYPFTEELILLPQK